MRRQCWIDPKKWKVEVIDGRLCLSADEKWKVRNGTKHVTRYEWSTKLSKYCASEEFIFEPGKYQRGKGRLGPNEWKEGSTGGQAKILFPLAKEAAAEAGMIVSVS